MLLPFLFFESALDVLSATAAVVVAAVSESRIEPAGNSSDDEERRRSFAAFFGVVIVAVDVVIVVAAAVAAGFVDILVQGPRAGLVPAAPGNTFPSAATVLVLYPLHRESSSLALVLPARPSQVPPLFPLSFNSTDLAAPVTAPVPSLDASAPCNSTKSLLLASTDAPAESAITAARAAATTVRGVPGARGGCDMVNDPGPQPGFGHSEALPDDVFPHCPEQEVGPPVLGRDPVSEHGVEYEEEAPPGV